MTGVMVQGRATAPPVEGETTQQHDRLQLTLLGGFELRQGGGAVELPVSAQRLVAFLAIRARPLQRLHVAGSLWLDAPEERANAALRTALWRSRRGCPLVDANGPSIGLAPGVEVDLHVAARLARRVLADPPGDVVELPGLDHVWANGELLPDWYDEWVLIERERHRQLRLHALERLCEALTVAGRHGEAVEAGIAAVASEPLRESAHRVLIAVHLAEGNVAEALRQYRLFRELLREQLGLDPSARLRELVERAVTPR